MAKENENENEIQFSDDDGFVTLKKGVTLTSVSSIIWVLTCMLYKILVLPFPQIDYEYFCFFTSLSFSILVGLFLIKKMLGKYEFQTKIFLGVINIVLLYTTANGIQAGYCFLSTQEVKASMLPFIEARPWLPDQFSQTIIQSEKSKNSELLALNNELVVENKKLSSNSVDPAKMNLAEAKIEMLEQDLQNLRQVNQQLQRTVTASSGNDCKEEVDRVKNEYKAEIEKLKQDITRMTNENQQLTAKLSSSSYDAYKAENARLETQLKNLMESIKDYNRMQAKIRNAIQLRPSLDDNAFYGILGKADYDKFFKRPIE